MHNLINKFEAEVSQTDDAGIVAIEYVVMAGVLIAASAPWRGRVPSRPSPPSSRRSSGRHLSLVLGRMKGEAPASPFALSLSFALSTESS